MRRWRFLLAAACTLVWSNLALAAAPTTDNSSNDNTGTRLQRKEAMVTSNKSKKQTNNKGGGIRSTKGTVHVTNTTIRNNAAFKIDDNEAPRPQDRLFLPYNYYNQNTPQYFVGGNVTGLFQRTNFSVVPPFNVDGSGAMGGVFGGVLIPLPNTNVLIGPRFGWEGGDINGNTVAPAASQFTYTTDKLDLLSGGDGKNPD